MSSLQKLRDQIDGVDIYLIDQILKGRYLRDDKILDAGCGSGRNLRWFANNQYHIYGIDKDPEAVKLVQYHFPLYKDNFTVTSIEQMAFKNNTFNHIICNAVLHFSKDEKHFNDLISGLVRVLKQKGSLFIRMASNFGMPDAVNEVSEGVFALPDGSERFLLTQKILDKLLNKYSLSFLEPIKTTNVSDLRWMTTLVLRKD